MGMSGVGGVLRSVSALLITITITITILMSTFYFSYILWYKLNSSYVTC